MRRIIVVHGIHTDDSEGWMDVVARGFKESGWDARVWTYGYAYAMLTRWQNPSRSRALASLVRAGDMVLGHSNGGCLAWLAAKLGAPLGGAILVNPALDSDRAMAPHVPWVNLYPNKYDEAVKIAKLFPAHPWGAQGRDGLTVPDARYMTRWTNEPSPLARPVDGHSAVWKPWAIYGWVRQMVKDANDRLKANQGGAGRALPRFRIILHRGKNQDLQDTY